MNGKFKADVATWQPSQYRRTHAVPPPPDQVVQAADLLLGAELPIITRALFLSYRFWFVVPVLFLVLAIDLLRHPQRSSIYVGLLVFAAVTSGFVMQAWLYEGCLMPLLQIMRTLS